MNTFDICLAAFLLALGTWSGIAAYAIADRLLYDRLAARMTLSALRQGRLPACAVSSLDCNIGSVPLLHRGAMRRLVLDPDQPDWLRNHVARSLSAAYGVRRLVRDAWGRSLWRSRWRRVGAWHVLHRTSAVDLHPMLNDAICGADGQLAAAAAAMLARLRDRRAAEILVEALREGRCPARSIAAQLDAFDARISAAVLVPLLDETLPLRLFAIELLGRHPPEGIALRLECFATDPDPGVRRSVARAMGDIGSPFAMAVVAGMLDDRVSYVRAQAVRSLLLISQTHHCSIASLVAPLRSDHDWWVRLAVREAYAVLEHAPHQGGAALARVAQRSARGDN